MPRRRPRPRPGLPVTSLATALLLAACGGGPPVSDADRTARTGSATFPVTVASAVGTVTVEKVPERVVALDFPSADAALALGAVPVGMAELSYIDGGVQQWTKARLGGAQPELFPTEDGFPFETIARLDPDVILATNTWPLISENWDKLNAIAPVIGHVQAPGEDSWQQGVTQVGKALGRSDQAKELIGRVEASLAGAQAAHPIFRGKTVSFFNYLASDGLYVINTNDDFSIKFLKELGFAGVTDVVANMPSPTGAGRAKVSPEQYALLDADLIVGTSAAARAQLDELVRHPMFSRVPAIIRGSWVPLDIGPATAMAFPSALSLPYAVDRLVPQMARATAGR
jgi:iron complex transport system substrate-binding protein